MIEITGQVLDKWGAIAGARGAHIVPIESRTVMLVSAVGAIIDNGGFEYLLEGTWSGDEELTHAVAAFNRIGCTEAASVIAFVMTQFLMQEKSSSLDPEERMDALHAAFPEEALTELGGRFWGQRDHIQKKLADYIFANKAQIDDQVRLDVKEYLKKFP